MWSLLTVIIVSGILGIIFIYGDEILDAITDVIDDAHTRKHERYIVDRKVEEARIKQSMSEIKSTVGILPEYVGQVNDKGFSLTQITCSCCGDSRLSRHFDLPHIMHEITNGPTKWHIVHKKPICYRCWMDGRYKTAGVESADGSEPVESAQDVKNEF